MARPRLSALEGLADLVFSNQLACFFNERRLLLGGASLALALDWPGLAGWVLASVGIYGAGRGFWWLRYRRLSTRLGLRAVFVYPASPWLLGPLLRRHGLSLTPGTRVWEPHVLTGSRRYRRLTGTPAERARIFRREMAEDYRRLVAALAGRRLCLVSNTFNRRPEWFVELLRGAGGLRTGVLCAGSLRLYRPAAHRRRQLALFGGVVGRRDVSKPEEWTIALLNLWEVPTDSAGEEDLCGLERC